jgi:hypothetical protein
VNSACPDTFHLCPRSAAEAGFSVLDRSSGTETEAATEAEARRVAERNYPGCEFALSTIAATHGGAAQPPGVPDAVVVAILRRLDDQRAAVIGYVVSGVRGAACIPFSAEVWPNIKDHLPRDGRRATVLRQDHQERSP